MNQKLVVIIVSLCLCLTGLISIAVAIAVGFKSADAPTTSATLTNIDNVTSDPTKETITTAATPQSDAPTTSGDTLINNVVASGATAVLTKSTDPSSNVTTTNITTIRRDRTRTSKRTGSSPTVEDFVVRALDFLGFVPNTDTVKSDPTTEASTTKATRQSDATTPGATPSNNVVASDITTGNTTAALGNQTKARKRPTKTTGSPSLIDLIIESI